ncbi:hypothetical protein NPIL_295111 [Nephila pilipes]|uniref:Uncharacterized protein n=1 Tax=Nephila pilipes TaxID=299642 RepID=A0A8X6MV09_NEPPI|nr:hypothetical protein NPIL_295111 [Nephila pilipes]
MIQSTVFDEGYIPKKEKITDLSKNVASEDFVSISGFKNWNKNREVRDMKPKMPLATKLMKKSKQRPRQIITPKNKDSSGRESLENRIVNAGFNLK